MRGSSDVPPQTLEWQAPGQRGSASPGSIAYSPATRWTSPSATFSTSRVGRFGHQDGDRRRDERGQNEQVPGAES